MEKVLFEKRLGLGIILESFDHESDYFIDKEFTINDESLKPGNPTTLSGFFDTEVTFCGAMLSDQACMVFYLGQDEDLFTCKKYYKCLFFITHNRVVDKFKEGTCRDYIFKNNQWK